MATKNLPRLSTRIVAALLAGIWLCAGLAIIALGILHGRWLMTLLGPPALWYGLMWVRVARQGRQLRWPDGLIPWQRQ